MNPINSDNTRIFDIDKEGLGSAYLMAGDYDPEPYNVMSSFAFPEGPFWKDNPSIYSSHRDNFNSLHDLPLSHHGGLHKHVIYGDEEFIEDWYHTFFKILESSPITEYRFNQGLDTVSVIPAENTLYTQYGLGFQHKVATGVAGRTSVDANIYVPFWQYNDAIVSTPSGGYNVFANSRLRHVTRLNAGDVRHQVMFNQLYSDAFPALIDTMDFAVQGPHNPTDIFDRFIPQFR